MLHPAHGWKRIEDVLRRYHSLLSSERNPDVAFGIPASDTVYNRAVFERVVVKPVVCLEMG